MKKAILNLIRKCVLPAFVAGAVLTLSAVGANAQNRGGYSGGHAYSGGRNYSGGSRGYNGGSRSYERGRDYDRGRSYGGGYYRGGGYYSGGGYYPGGVYLNFGAPYAYTPAPCGYYDRWGYWHTSPGCYYDGPRY